MRLKPRQNHEESERGAYAGETGSAKWGSKWPKLGAELRLARQTGQIAAKQKCMSDLESLQMVQ